MNTLPREDVTYPGREIDEIAAPSHIGSSNHCVRFAALPS